MSWQQNSQACAAVEQCAHTDIHNLGMVIVMLLPDGLYEYFSGGDEIQRATTYYWYHTVH